MDTQKDPEMYVLGSSHGFLNTSTYARLKCVSSNL